MNEFIPKSHITRDEAANLLSDLKQHLPNLLWPHQFTETLANLEDWVTPTRIEEASVSGEAKRDEYQLSYASQLETLKNALGLSPQVVFAPGHGLDVSHCEVFADARKIINLDPDPKAVNVVRALYLNEPKVCSHFGIIETFTPDELADLMVIASECFHLKSLRFEKFLKSGAMILSRAYDDAFLRNSDRFECLGSTCFGGTGFLSSEQARHISTGVRPRTDRELRDCSMYRAASAMDLEDDDPQADFAEVIGVVYQLTGSYDDLVNTYAYLRRKGAEETAEWIACGEVLPELWEWRQYESEFAPSFRRHRLHQVVRDNDIFTREGRDALIEELYKNTPVLLKRQGQTFILNPLVKWVREFDMAAYRFTG